MNHLLSARLARFAYINDRINKTKNKTRTNSTYRDQNQKIFKQDVNFASNVYEKTRETKFRPQFGHPRSVIKPKSELRKIP